MNLTAATGYFMTMMRSRGLLPALFVGFAALVAPSPAVAQVGHVIDEGVFSVARKGAPAQTESFKIVRMDNGLIQATCQIVAGDERLSSSLLADSLGSPLSYLFLVKDHGATTLTVRAIGASNRLSLSSSDNRSNESMRDFPVTTGRTLLLDDWLLHQLYFAALRQRTGNLDVIEPRTARHATFVLTSHGLDQISVAGRNVTATHYSLVNGATAREFWVDASGRLLKVEIPAQGLVATREELPR